MSRVGSGTHGRRCRAEETAGRANAMRPRVRQPYERLLDKLRRRVVDGRGRLDSAVRRAAFAGEAVPADVAAFVDKVRRNAYKVVDGDVGSLLAAGHSADEIFELTVATALGAGLSRLDAARRAMGQAG